MNANLMETTSTRAGMTLKNFGFILVLGAVSVLLGLTGCNTAHGFGKDMQKAGEGIQDGTR